jgi:hypothetical protein
MFVGAIGFLALSSVYAVTPSSPVPENIPDSTQIEVPEVPSDCFDKKDYCFEDGVIGGGFSGKAQIAVQVFMLHERQSGESDQDLAERLKNMYMDFDAWNSYALQVDPTGKYLDYQQSTNVTSVAAAAPFSLNTVDVGYHYVDYEVAGPLGTKFQIAGTYEHKLLEPMGSDVLLSASLELITEKRDDNFNGLPLAQLMPAPLGVSPQIKGINWHWAFLHVVPFADDDSFVVVILDTYQQPSLSLLPGAAVDPIKRSLLAIMGGMLDIQVDFTNLK